MLKDEGGRYQSVRTEDELVRLFRQELESLTPEERTIAFRMLEDQLQEGFSAAAKVAAQDIYIEPPVPIDVFLNDEYFLGRIGHTLYPELKQALIDVFTGGYHTAILGGSLGLGKTTFGCIAILRMAYELSRMRNMHEAFAISASDTVALPCISATEDAAERNILDKIRGYLEESPFFSQEFVPVKNTAGFGILFPNKLLIPPGASTAAGVLGANAIAAFIDESNFFRSKSEKIRANAQVKTNIEIIYESIKRRIESRFMTRGKLPGCIVIASSKTHTDAFTERLIRKSVDDPRVYVKEKAAYEVQPKSRYSGKMFQVAIGSEAIASRILSEGENAPEGTNVIDVPVENRRVFEEDIDKAIMDVAGRSVVAITPFIARREKIMECVDARPHPFNQETWEQDFPGEWLWDCLSRQRGDGGWEPRVDPMAPRHAHLDLSKNNDHTGICIAHIAGYRQVQRLGSESSELAPIIYVDAVLRIKAPTGGEIVYAEIRRLLYELQRHGFYIKLTSADQFMSAPVLQTLESQGFKTALVSVDRPGAYETLKQAIYEQRIKTYNYPPLIKQLRELQKDWKTGKVDHPETGEKDVSDALAGVCATLSEVKTVVTDQPIHTTTRDVIDSEEHWFMDGVPVNSGQPQNPNAPEWRRNAESMELKDKRGYADWRSNFQMPFTTG